MRISLVFLLGVFMCKAQPGFNKYDYLHGKLTANRSCFNVQYYDITLKVEPEKKQIIGVNKMTFKVVSATTKLQLDLNAALTIDSILFSGMTCQFKRDSNTFFVALPQKLKVNQVARLDIYWSGRPHVAKKAPWDGGFVWSKDSSGKDWVGMACEGIGPQIWLPCKDHWSDEADSMSMQLIVPKDLVGVSNGKLIEVTEEGLYKKYQWKVINPINTYSISVNIGDYKLITDSVSSINPLNNIPLQCSYYVLRGNEHKAKSHFKQVATMLNCNERYFGPYPFWNDSYKLVETPYWGMEHQSCVAYGNNYKNNLYGFDFIIIHESAHEWFANSITASDPADMWIHESFTTYAEALFVEYTLGYKASVNYLLDQKVHIKCAQPMVGPHSVYYHGRTDNDIYYKGTWILHTMRSVINNDSAWFAALKGFYQTFEKKIITTKDVITYFNQSTDRNWDAFFNQYLYKKELPVLQYKVETSSDGNIVVRYRWRNVVKGFDMPIRVTMTKDKWETITPLTGWQLIDLNFFDEQDFKIQTDHFLIDLQKLNSK